MRTSIFDNDYETNTLFLRDSSFKLFAIISNSILVGANNLATTTNICKLFSPIGNRSHSNTIYRGNLTVSHPNGNKISLKYAWTIRLGNNLIELNLIIQCLIVTLMREYNKYMSRYYFYLSFQFISCTQGNNTVKKSH